MKRKGKDPKGFIVEYIVWSAKAFAPDPHAVAEKRMNCNVRIRDGEECRPLVDSDADFDTGWLSESDFFGAECKVSIRNFTNGGGNGISGRADRKYSFMTDTHRKLVSLGKSSRICLVGCDRDVDTLRAVINSAGFEEIELIGGDELEQLLRKE